MTVSLPVALFHQSFPFFLAGVLLPFIGLVQYLLGSRAPFEAIPTHLLTGRFGAGVIYLAHALALLVEFWKEKQQLILTGFVCHISRTLDCLVEF